METDGYLGDAGTGEGHNHGHHIDGQLELQEFGDAVVDIPAPHNGLHDAGEVIVGQDDVGCLLGHVGTGDALQVKRRMSCTSLQDANRAHKGMKLGRSFNEDILVRGRVSRGLPLIAWTRDFIHLVSTQSHTTTDEGRKVD